MASGAQRVLKPLLLLSLFVLGPCLLAGSLVSAYRTHSFLSRSATADGAIVEMKLIVTRRSHRSFMPIFAFTAEDGRTWTVASGVATNPPVFKVGDRVKVHYEPAHPEQARIDSFSQLWLFDLATGAFGSIFTLVLLFAIFARRGPARVYSRSDFHSPADQR